MRCQPCIEKHLYVYICIHTVDLGWKMRGKNRKDKLVSGVELRPRGWKSSTLYTELQLSASLEISLFFSLIFLPEKVNHRFINLLPGQLRPSPSLPSTQKVHILKTMEFVEQYLALPSVWNFEDKEQNLLTYEVMVTSSAGLMIIWA